MRPPFDDAPQKDPGTLHKLVREGKRPLLNDKVIAIILSLSTVVLNSRDQQGKLWLPQFSHLQQPP